MRRTLGRKPYIPRKRPAGEQEAAERFRSVVFHRAEGRSQITGATEYPMDVHHVVKQQQLRHIAPDLQWDPDGAILLTRSEHQAHENRAIVITYEQLPEYVHRWLERHDLEAFVERYHPRRKAA